MCILRAIFFLSTMLMVLPIELLDAARKRGREEEPAAASSMQKCAICLSDMEKDPAANDAWIDQAPLSAGHLAHPMHRECLAAWWKISQTCPVCKGMATDKELKAMGISRKRTADDGQYTRFMNAIDNDDIAAIDELIAQGFDVNREISFGRTALIIAAGRSSVPLINKILSAGANINHTDFSGENALLTALKNNNESVIEQLLAVPEINILCRGNQGDSTLIYAIKRGDYALFDRICATPGHEELITAAGLLGNTPLHYAALEGLPGTAQYLLDHGADIKCKNIQGKTALDLARERRGTVVGARLVLETAMKKQALVGAIARSKALQDTISY